MSENIVLMPGSTWLESPVLHRIAGEFGWQINAAHAMSDVTEKRTAAVLFSRDALGTELGWLETTRQLRSALPGVPLVACHRFTEIVDWPALCEAGAFHSLWLPLKENEVRRSFGFVWQAEKRLAVSGLRAVA